MLLADALGKPDKVFESLSLLARRTEQPPTMPDLLQRYGRSLLEAGKAQESLRELSQPVSGSLSSST